jgi:hypothetical protein
MNVPPTEMVDCKVSVSPALARRIRKAELAEQTGQDARGALMIAAGYEPDEVDEIRSKIEDMSREIIANEQEQAITKATADQLVTDLGLARQKVSELGVANKRITVLEKTLAHSVETGDLSDELVKKISNLVEALRGGDKLQMALLAAAGYDLDEVDKTMSLIDTLKANNEDLEHTVTPLRKVLGSKGIKSWMVRHIMGLS